MRYIVRSCRSRMVTIFRGSHHPAFVCRMSTTASQHSCKITFAATTAAAAAAYAAAAGSTSCASGDPCCSRHRKSSFRPRQLSSVALLQNLPVTVDDQRDDVDRDLRPQHLHFVLFQCIWRDTELTEYDDKQCRQLHHLSSTVMNLLLLCVFATVS